MMYRRKPGPRLLAEWQVEKMLAQGGMLLAAPGGWDAYRTPDARRMRVGAVPEALAARLETDGRAVRLAGEPARLVAGPWLDA